MMYEANTMVNMIAVNKPNVLIRNEYILRTNRTHAITERAELELILVFLFTLGWKVIWALSHRFRLAWIKKVLKLRQSLRLNIIHLPHIWFGLLKKKDDQVFAFEVDAGFVFWMY